MSFLPQVLSVNTLVYPADDLVSDRPVQMGQIVGGYRLPAAFADQDDLSADIDAGNIRNVDHHLIHTDPADDPGFSAVDQHKSFV